MTEQEELMAALAAHANLLAALCGIYQVLNAADQVAITEALIPQQLQTVAEVGAAALACSATAQDGQDER